MFILYFALWVVLNGKWTTEIGVFGLVFATVIYAFTWKYMDYGPKLDIALMKRIPYAVRYGVTLTVEIIKANIAVCKMILKPDFVPEPQLVQFDVDLKKNRHLVALANSITLTPGTITVELEDNHFLVHALDASLVDGLDDGCFVQSLMQMEKAHGYTKAAAPAEEANAPQEALVETAQAMEETNEADAPAQAEETNEAPAAAEGEKEEENHEH